MTLPAVVAIALLAAVAPGCRRGNRAPPCREVAARTQAVARADVATVLRTASGEQLIATLHALADGTFDTIERACRDDRWPDQVRRCFAAAQTPEALRTCRDQMPAPLRERLREPLLPGDVPDVVRQRIDTVAPGAGSLER
jgi:hypothetical protein